jgi:tripartite-type tricarboxylate transporter receptor subunit TctC
MRVATAAVTLASLWPIAALHAQAYPTKPIRMIVNFPPGGGTDVTARIMQPALTREIGQQILIDNRGGAAGAVGAEIASRAAGDGYTLLWTLSSHTTNPSLYAKLSFDADKDFAPITLGANAPQIVVATTSLPVKDIRELIAYAKANPGKVTYASPGVGSPGHLAGELLKQQAGINMLHVPYKGAGPAIPDVISGNVSLMISSMSAAMSHVRAGKMRALGVTSLKRSAGGPDIPAIAEGLAGFELPSWFGLLAPAGTPQPIIDRWHQAMVRVLAIPEVRDQLIAQGADPVGSTPDQFARQIREELKLWAKLIKQSGIKAE